MLSSFQIENFRAFRQLHLPKLGQVNLIVGRNNSGKTMLLDALRLHASQGQAGVIRELLVERDEFDRSARISRAQFVRMLRLESLFYKRQVADIGRFLQIGPIEQPDNVLTVRPVRVRRVGDRTGPESWQIYDPKASKDSPGVEISHVLGLSVAYGNGPERVVPPEPVERFFLPIPGLMPGGDTSDDDATAYVPARGIRANIVASWWDAVTLTDAEDRIIQCLRIIAPVQRISLVGGGDNERTVMVKLEGEVDPVPLRSLGDGVRKMFDFALGLEAARNGKPLLIDEIENGIHYSVHEDLWRFIIEAARRTNVQVFATTHSWDCVMAFQSAITAQPGIDAYGIRLFRSSTTSDIDAVILDRRDLATATRDQVDFR